MVRAIVYTISIVYPCMNLSNELIDAWNVRARRRVREHYKYRVIGKTDSKPPRYGMEYDEYEDFEVRRIFMILFGIYWFIMFDMYIMKNVTYFFVYKLVFI